MFVTEPKRSDVNETGERCEMTLSRTDDERIQELSLWYCSAGHRCMYSEGMGRPASAEYIHAGFGTLKVINHF